MLDLDELKKNHDTSYLAEALEKLAREEKEVREMLAGDDTLHELAAKELKFIQEERERIEKQVQEILAKDKEIIGIIAVADTLKDHSKVAVEMLHKIGKKFPKQFLILFQRKFFYGI